ncbi:MAG: ankyrin repeat domain-containing protein [Planctomycetota bacterium]|jgi:pectate lyase
MRGRFIHQAVLGILLIYQFSACLAAETPNANDSTTYLDAVREFADNVLEHGRDKYGPKHTPLFVDGLNVNNLEPVKWISPKGDVLTATETEKWILSNFASQQTLLRTLDGLSNITGDTKYRQAATDAIKYAFDHLRNLNGLFYWGHITAYDALGDTPRGDTSLESIKLHYPYYELMWKVDPDATKKLIEALWCAHVMDWSNLDFNRNGLTTANLEEPWNHEYDKEHPTFFKSKYGGGGFISTASSLIQAGTTLYRLSSQEQPLVWSKRLAKRFIDTRHPRTGISAFIYNDSLFQLGEDMKGHFVDQYTTVFPYNPFEYRYLYYPENAHAHPWIGIFLVGRMLGGQGGEFTRWALEESTAWGRVSYRKKDNCFVPMLTDGTSLEGYVWKDSPASSSGLTMIKPYPADLSFFWNYSVAYCETGDRFMWQMVREIALGNNLGDIGQTPGEAPKLQINTACSNAHGIFGFLELYAKTKKPAFLEMAQRIGDNILSSRFHRGFFVESKRHIYSRFACFEPLALLHLYRIMKSTAKSVPQAWPGIPLFVSSYRYRQGFVDRQVIYALTESPEPPFSLQEAAAIGNLKLVRCLLDKGVGVDSLDDSYFKTALHRAAISGHKDITKLLLAKGAHVDALDGWPRGTPLNHAAEKGHSGIAELLIAHGADVNVTRGYPAVLQGLVIKKLPNCSSPKRRT